MIQHRMKSCIAMSAWSCLGALVIGCNNNSNSSPSHPAAPASQSQSSQSPAGQQSSGASLNDVAGELHTQSMTLVGASEGQYRQSLGHSLELVSKAISQLDPMPAPAQSQRVQIIQQAASRISAGNGPLEPVINSSLRAAVNALESIVHARFPEQGEIITMVERLRDQVERLDSVHGGLHQLDTSTAVGHASDLISRMVARIQTPQPTTTATPSGSKE
jgi:hypothetical protein